MLFGSQLTPNERMEIQCYPEIYYLGQDMQTKLDAERKLNGGTNEKFKETYDDNTSGYLTKVIVG